MRILRVENVRVCIPSSAPKKEIGRTVPLRGYRTRCWLVMQRIFKWLRHQDKNLRGPAVLYPPASTLSPPSSRRSAPMRIHETRTLSNTPMPKIAMTENTCIYCLWGFHHDLLQEESSNYSCERQLTKLTNLWDQQLELHVRMLVPC